MHAFRRGALALIPDLGRMDAFRRRVHRKFLTLVRPIMDVFCCREFVANFGLTVHLSFVRFVAFRLFVISHELLTNLLYIAR